MRREDILASGVPDLLGQEWYSSEYWLLAGPFPDQGSTERYYRFGFDIGFTVGLVLLGIPGDPSPATLGRAGDGADGAGARVDVRNRCSRSRD